MRHPSNSALHQRVNALRLYRDEKTLVCVLEGRAYPLDGHTFRFSKECATILEAILLHTYLLAALASITNAALELGYRTARDKNPKWWTL